MEDRIRNTFLSQSRMQKPTNYRHLQTDHRSVGYFPATPEICRRLRLKTRMTGGKARNDQV